MDDLRKDELPFIPPQPGGDWSWLSFHPFPLHEFPDAEKGAIPPWFDRFLSVTPEQARDVLTRQWRILTPDSLKKFSDNLLTYTPCGLLYSQHSDGRHNTWLVLSRWSVDRELLRSIPTGESVGGVLFLPPPYPGPAPKQIAPDDLLLRFFLNFAGLRQSLPFQAGFFYDIPLGPTEIEPGELDKPQYAPWKNATAVFLSDCGDELLVSNTGQTGWLLHDTRKIISYTESFNDVLVRISTECGLSPVFD